MSDAWLRLDRSPQRLAVAGAALVLGAAVVWRVAVTVGHARLAVYQLPPVAVAVVVAAAVLCGLALVIAVASARPLVAAVALLTAAALLVGVFLILPLVLVVAGVLLMVRMLSGVPGGQGALSVASGVTAALAAITVWIVSSQPPLVSCTGDGGVETSDRAWWGGGPSDSVGGGTSSGGTSRGFLKSGSTRVTYVCDGGTLTELHVTSGG